MSTNYLGSSLAGNGSGLTALNPNSVLSSQSSNSGKFLTTDGTVLSWGTASAGGTATLTSTSPTTVSGYVKPNGTVIGSGVASIPASDGGTGQTSYSVGDLLYASGTTAISKLSAVGTGSVLTSQGTGTAPAYGQVGLTTHVSGTLPVANGGTGTGTIVGMVASNGTSFFGASAGSDFVSPSAETAFTKQQWFGTQNLSSTSGTISWVLQDKQVARHTFTENTTLANPTYQQEGAMYVLALTQHASSPKTLSFGSAYKWPGGTTFTVSSTAGAKDILTFYSDGTNMYGMGQKAFA